MLLSIVICTHNRSLILTECLASILMQNFNPQTYEVLIVDNASTDNTSEVVEEFMEVGFKYYHEKNLGLSYARNRGLKEAQGEWLCYIDDDARMHSNYLERAIWVIDNYDFDCFGGMYFAWHLYEKPKWLNNAFGTKQLLSSSICQILEPLLSGGNFLIKKTILKEIGGFPLNLGMNADRIAYGEEIAVQMKILERGKKLGFDPGLKIDHAVLPHKYKLFWHLKSEFAKGRDNQSNNRYSFLKQLFLFVKSLLGIIIEKIPKGIYKKIVNDDFYVENVLLYIASPLLYRLGGLYSSILTIKFR